MGGNVLHNASCLAIRLAKKICSASPTADVINAVSKTAAINHRCKLLAIRLTLLISASCPREIWLSPLDPVPPCSCSCSSFLPNAPGPALLVPLVLLAFSLSSAAFALLSLSSCEFGLAAVAALLWLPEEAALGVEDNLCPPGFGRETHEPIVARCL